MCRMLAGAGDASLASVAPGSMVVVRDEEWMVTGVSQTRDGTLVSCQGLSELVAGSTAQFLQALDEIIPFEPRDTKVVPDLSRNHQRARLWLEATLRKTPLPIDDQHLAVSTNMLADALGYQREAVSKALDPDTLRPRILLADAVGCARRLSPRCSSHRRSTKHTFLWASQRGRSGEQHGDGREGHGPPGTALEDGFVGLKATPEPTRGGCE